MIQQLPLEIVTAIAGFLSSKETGEFAKTCQKCYFAVLPHMWHQLEISNTQELSRVAKKLETNQLWSGRAIQVVRNVTFHRCSNKKFSSSFAASMFGIASTQTDQQNEKAEQGSVKPCERISAFGRRLLELWISKKQQETFMQLQLKKKNIHHSRVHFHSSIIKQIIPSSCTTY
jgi:hypothetical protein